MAVISASLQSHGSYLVETDKTQTPPNVIIVLADDLGYSDLGCFGGEIPTPNIDALAKRGVRMAHLYTSARCCPTRASLMTGLYPTQAGIGDFTSTQPDKKRGPGYLGRLSENSATIAEVLKPAGYQCYYVGKWHMHSATGPIRRSFDEFYGYLDDHSHDQFDAQYYKRLPEGREKEVHVADDQFYATDVFNQYALEFIRKGQESRKPWCVFLGHSSPHFPIQAPADRVEKFESIYRRGWDVLREERFERMKKLGLVDGPRWKLTPRSIVPVDEQAIANGYSGVENPAWDSLSQDQQIDLARRMAVFAAMVESIDVGVGQIVQHLQQTGTLENTLILLLSDNGACYEWGPLGFDGVSRKGTTTLHTGAEVKKVGGPGTHQSYGSGWANLGNTPFRMYKHFTHEGGICTPFIAHWPRLLSRWIRSCASPHMSWTFFQRLSLPQVRSIRGSATGIPCRHSAVSTCYLHCEVKSWLSDPSALTIKGHTHCDKAIGRLFGPSGCLGKSNGNSTTLAKTVAKPRILLKSTQKNWSRWSSSGTSGLVASA